MPPCPPPPSQNACCLTSNAERPSVKARLQGPYDLPQLQLSRLHAERDELEHPVLGSLRRGPAVSQSWGDLARGGVRVKEMGTLSAVRVSACVCVGGRGRGYALLGVFPFSVPREHVIPIRRSRSTRFDAAFGGCCCGEKARIVEKNK